MRAFIIRPFGTQKEIDFNEVARLLISPALEELGAEGRETLDIVEAGNIRADMFRRLLTADIVVADLSIHNANVFYELGIRHALRNHGTVMLRCDADKFPFDLQTDRYFVYRKEDPAAGVAALVATLRRTAEAAKKNPGARDSPVFSLLPALREQDSSIFNLVPRDFALDVARAAEAKRAGDLALLSYEAKGLEWEIGGWRTVGRAQFNLKAWVGAKETWERVLALEPDDPEANLLLGTVYERLGDLTLSTAALERVRDNPETAPGDRAEAYSLLARNAKTRWRGDWEARPPEARAAAALRSPHLLDSFENYERAFYEDLNHFYSGLNALAMVKVMLGLAEALPVVWAGRFRKASKAEEALEEHREHAAKLAGAVELALAAAGRRLEREGKKDVWVDISVADHCFLTTDEASPFVASGYRDALADAPAFAAEAVSRQLAIYRDLGVLGANLAEVFEVVGEPPPLPAPAAEPAAAPAPRQRVLLFAGHMIDAPTREHPRFPADKEDVAREKIEAVVAKEKGSGAGVASAYAGGANGGDILFQEVCKKLGITTRLYLAIPPKDYVRKSVRWKGAREGDDR
ncbi:MAG TPA: tetratricopeptide repeat-containing protein, partial [Pyrinomonadaceae bacterium]|nr:tetratricopeptide repeat-containing protein [Pyrinomonadaceae bacterium]